MDGIFINHAVENVSQICKIRKWDNGNLHLDSKSNVMFYKLLTP